MIRVPKDDPNVLIKFREYYGADIDLIVDRGRKVRKHDLNGKRGADHKIIKSLFYLSDMLLNKKCYDADDPMVEEKQIPFPASISKGFFTLILVIGILLLVVWTALMFIKTGRIIDWGIYSFTIVMILMGLFGRMLYSHKQDHGS